MDTPSVPQTKCCTKCRIEYPATAEYFARDKSKADGLYSSCKSCVKIHQKKERDDKPEYVRERERKARSKRAPIINERRREQYAENPEPFRVRNREARRRNIEKVRKQESASYARNKDKWRENRRLYYLRTRDTRGIYSTRYHARKRGLPVSFTKKDWLRALTYFDHRCAVCGRPAGLWHTLAKDHWIPLTSSCCPGTVPGNIVPLCHGDGGCNCSKKNSDPEIWLIRKFGKRKAQKVIKGIEKYFEWVTNVRDTDSGIPS